MLSVIIVNYRTWDHVARNLDSLFSSLPAGVEPAKDFEILVVDNHSDDGRFNSFQARYPQVRLMLSGGNFGYAYGCNQGAGAARGDWLLFMNPDVVCDWENLSALWSAAREHRDWAILTAPQYDTRQRLQRSFAPFTTLATYFPTVRSVLRLVAPRRYPNPRTSPEKLDGIVEVDWVTGSLVMVSRQDFQKLGGWDEDFWLYCEDEDLCRRAHDLGMRVGYFPGAVFVHAHASSTRSSQAITVLTKSETILSKYLYLSKHERNMSGCLLRAIMRWGSAVAYPVWCTLDGLSLGRVRKITQKRKIHQRLRSYFARAKKTGVLLSERSINFDKERSPGY